LKREPDEDLHVFNQRFYHIYHDMTLEIWPTEMATMLYYVMAHHSDLVLLLFERNSSSLSQMFEDAQGVEENVHVSRRIQEQVDFENLHAHEKEECQYTLDFEQEGNEGKVDLEQ
jgi:hypothetical protein